MTLTYRPYRNTGPCCKNATLHVHVSSGKIYLVWQIFFSVNYNCHVEQNRKDFELFWLNCGSNSEKRGLPCETWRSNKSWQHVFFERWGGEARWPATYVPVIAHHHLTLATNLLLAGFTSSPVPSCHGCFCPVCFTSAGKTHKSRVWLTSLVLRLWCTVDTCFHPRAQDEARFFTAVREPVAIQECVFYAYDLWVMSVHTKL